MSRLSSISQNYLLTNTNPEVDLLTLVTHSVNNWARLCIRRSVLSVIIDSYSLHVIDLGLPYCRGKYDAWSLIRNWTFFLGSCKTDGVTMVSVNPSFKGMQSPLNFLWKLHSVIVYTKDTLTDGTTSVAYELWALRNYKRKNCSLHTGESLLFHYQMIFRLFKATVCRYSRILLF